MKASERLGETSGQWWSGSSGMGASQVYPKTFGRADPCMQTDVNHVHSSANFVYWCLYQVALILRMLLRDPADRVINMLPYSIPRIAAQLAAEDAWHSVT